MLLTPASQSTAQHEQHLLRELSQQRIDGLILLTSFKSLPDPILNQLRQSTRPIVQITTVELEFDSVHDGYAEGTRSLLRYLYEMGHRRFGFIYGVTLEPQGHDRLFTYAAFMKETEIPPEQAW